jgi:transposase
VIDYETFSKIHDCHDRQGLTIAQTARALGLHRRTVAKWLAYSRFEPRRSRPRASILDPFKPRIMRLLDTYPYCAQQIFQRLREEGYGGGATIPRRLVGGPVSSYVEKPALIQRTAAERNSSKKPSGSQTGSNDCIY